MFVAVPASIPTLVPAQARLSFSSSSQFVLSNPNHRPLVCRSSLDESKQQIELEQRALRSVLVERYEDGKAKRYVLDTNRHLQSFWEGEESLLNEVHDDDSSNPSFLLKIFRDFVLPASFPGSAANAALLSYLLKCAVLNVLDKDLLIGL